MYLRLVAILTFPGLIKAVGFSSHLENHNLRMSQGKMQYEVISVDSRMPRYGSCWKEALAELDDGCKNLDDDVQSRLSLSFANCFLAKAGMRTYPCEKTQQISDCLVNMDNNAFTTYSNFFTHTQNMCYFLQSQVWQEETDLTVERLTMNSEKVSRSLEESFRLQDQILQRQQRTMEYQQQLVENGTYLTKAIEVSKENVRDMLVEFKTSTDEQKNLIFEVFDRVSRLQNLVVSEVNWLYTVVFYGVCLLVIYVVTATKRTADARLCLLVVLSLNFCVERMVCTYSLPNDHSKISTDIPETVYGRIWIVRQLAIGLCVVILTVFVLKYKDYNIINNTLLQEIKKQNMDLKRSMEMFQVGNRKGGYQFSQDVTDGGALSNKLAALLAEDTGFLGDEDEETDEYSDNDDSDSFNSTRTDVTYDPSMSGDWSEDEFDTAENSREHSGNITPTNKTIDDALDALCGRSISSVEAYPSVLNCSSPSIKTVYEAGHPRPRRGRPPGSKNATPTPDKDRYELRSRRPSELNSTQKLAEETPAEFGRLVRQQLGTSRRNFSKWKTALKKENENYSSDEEGG